MQYTVALGLVYIMLSFVWQTGVSGVQWVLDMFLTCSLQLDVVAKSNYAGSLLLGELNSMEQKDL